MAYVDFNEQEYGQYKPPDESPAYEPYEPPQPAAPTPAASSPSTPSAPSGGGFDTEKFIREMASGTPFASDPRQYNASREVLQGYLTPDESRERGMDWRGRPNEPTPYRTEDEAAMRSRPYDYRQGLDDAKRPWTPEAQWYAKVGNYDYSPYTGTATRGGGSSAPGGAGPWTQRGPTVPAQFTDPITSMVEQFAQSRAQERESPSGGSGQALLEQALRDVSSQFQGGGFTKGEQEVFQTQALDPLEQLRTARKRQVMEQLSARGIDPKSGVALQMLQDVDRQFDGLRAQTQRSIAAQGAQETSARMQTAIQLLSGLAGTENDRLNEGYRYRREPMNLADRSFNQAFQMYNAAGNPLAMAGPLTALSQQQQGRGDNLQETLGYLAAILAAQG